MSLQQDYESNTHRWLEWKSELLRQLSDLVKASGVRFHTIEARVKPAESFMRKAPRYADPINDMHDIVAARIIVYYEDDVGLVCDEIERALEVNRAESTGRAEEPKPNEFGYASVHLIVRDARSTSVSRGRPTGDGWAEIQVRTVMQHGWAAVSHALQYKSLAAVPPRLQRRLNRLSGLLELADAEFSQLRKLHDELREEASSKLASNHDGSPVDAISLAAYLHLNGDYVRWARSEGARAGFLIVEEPDGDPADLAWACAIAGIRSISDLERALARVRDGAQTYLAEIRSSGLDSWHARPQFVLFLLLVGSEWRKFDLASLAEYTQADQLSRLLLEAARRLLKGESSG